MAISTPGGHGNGTPYGSPVTASTDADLAALQRACALAELRFSTATLLSTFAVMRRPGPRLAGLRGFLGLWLVGVVVTEIWRR